VFGEPHIGRGFSDEDLEMVDVADQFSGIDVNPTVVIRPSLIPHSLDASLCDQAYGTMSSMSRD